jgi:hypothetical protein
MAKRFFYNYSAIINQRKTAILANVYLAPFGVYSLKTSANSFLSKS